jgi:tetratricopeptide (TPR) repeat protein
LLPALLLLLLPLSGVSQELGELSLTYLEQARDALAEGASTEAELYLETALSLTPDLGDAMVALGAYLGERGDVPRGIALLERSLEEARFLETSEEQARIELAALYVRTGRYAAAYDALRPVSLPLSEALYLRGLAALGDERLLPARRAAERGRALYPEDARFVDLQYRLDSLPPISLERWLENNRSSDPAYLALFGRFLLQVADTEAYREEAQTYLRLGGSDPAVAARYADVIEDGVGQFLELEGHRDKYALEVASAHLSDAAAGTLLEAAKERLRELEQPVRLAYDPDRDGYENGAFYWQGGGITRWERDADQDGVAEFILRFGPSGIPEEASYDNTLRLAYAVYPYLGSGELTGGDLRRTLYLTQGSLAHHALSQTPSVYAEREDLFHAFEVGHEPPDREVLRRYAALEVLEEGDGGTTYVQLLSGVPLVAYRDAEGDGRAEEIRLFRDGSMREGLVDPDGDGHFEIYERFGEDGILLQGVDEDESGRSEIFLSLLDRMARWDSDEDRLLDFGVVTDQIAGFMEIERRVRNTLEYQLELFGNRTAQ